MSRIVRVNYYSLMVGDDCYLSGLVDFQGGLEAIKMVLTSRKWPADEVYNHPLSMWLNPDNKFGVWLRVVKGHKSEMSSTFNDAENRVLSSIKAFGGDCLKYNTIEEPSKWRPNAFQAPEVWVAMSATRHKGLSTLGKPKKSKGINYDAVGIIERINQQPDQGVYVKRFNLFDRITSLKSKGLSNADIYHQLKGKVGLSNKQLRKTIWEQ